MTCSENECQECGPDSPVIVAAIRTARSDRTMWSGFLTPRFARSAPARPALSAIIEAMRDGRDDTGLRGRGREIVSLALPALLTLAAEPLYVLVDTAIVGHLGVAALGALALAGTVLSAAVTLCNFLAYGSTPIVGRLHSQGRDSEAIEVGRQAILLAAGIGAALGLIALAGAGVAVKALGGHGELDGLATLYMRVSAAGLPFALIAVAGQGYLRGVSRLRLPLLLVIGCNVLNGVLEAWFVYGLHWGIAGSAWATVIAQTVGGVGFVAALSGRLTRGGRRLSDGSGRGRSGDGGRRRSGRGGRGRLRRRHIGMRRHLGAWRPQPRTLRSLLRPGGQIVVRTGSLYATFLLAGAILARTSDAALAAHEVAFQLWIFLALTLDALAIAAQILVSQALGGGNRGRARASATQILAWSVGFGVVLAVAMYALSGPLPEAFTSSGAVLREVHDIWPIFVLMQPLNGAVFALDGILLGASDTRFLMWAMVASAAIGFLPLALSSLIFGWGMMGVWLAILGLVLARLLSLGVRFRGSGWLSAGAGGVGDGRVKVAAGEVA